MSYRDREPDIETNQTKVWLPNQLEKEELTGIENDAIPYIMKNGQEVMFFADFVIRDKKTKEIVFAFKIKHEEKFILYGIWKMREKANVYEKFLRKMLNETGRGHWELRNMSDYEDDWIETLGRINSGKM